MSGRDEIRGVDAAPVVRLDGNRKVALEVGRTRIAVAGAVFALLFLVLAGRVVDLALFRHGEPHLAAGAVDPALLTERADIVDRNGVVLATSLPTASLYANPRHLRAAGEDPAATARRLTALLPDLDTRMLAERLSQDRAFVYLRRNLTPRQQYEVNRLGVAGLYFQRDERRVYPHGALAGHVLGLTDIDGRGIAGIEKAFDERLRGTESPLALSLDVRVQAIVRTELAGAMDRFSAVGGSAVVMDVRNAEVLAMVSLPDFDPNDPATMTGEAAFNRASKGVYELGSVFKLFNTAMALDAGVVDLADGYDATEPLRVARFVIRDFHPKRRWLSVPEILVYSSNIGSAKMAQDIGTERQQVYLRRFGLLDRVGLEIPEVGAPLVPSPWRDINTMTIAYGHGIAVNPVQLATGIAALANGGIMHRPTLIRRDVAPEGRRVIAERTSRHMRSLMRLVVRHGSGRRADAAGYMVGGKTGTAEKLGGGRYDRDALMSTFVGVFPVNDPRYLVMVSLDEPQGTKETFGYATGGWVAAPSVKRIVERTAPLLGIAPVAPGSETNIEDSPFISVKAET